MQPHNDTFSIGYPVTETVQKETNLQKHHNVENITTGPHTNKTNSYMNS